MSEPDLIIVFPIFPQVTQLDFTGPAQVLAQVPRAKIVVASTGGGMIASDCGLTFAHVEKLAAVERCDVLCVPGGYGQIAAMQDPAFMAEIVRLGRMATYVTSVCTGSLILAAAGFLKGKRAACHWASRHFLADLGALPDTGRVVRDGNFITGGGVTAGIDFALVLAAELAGRDIAESIQLRLEYAPEPPYNTGRPETAPEETVQTVRNLFAKTIAERRNAIAGIL